MARRTTRTRPHTDLADRPDLPDHPSAAAGPLRETVVVRGDDVRVDRTDDTVAREEVSRRFGGLDAFAVLAGALAAIGALVVLAAVVSAFGSIGFDRLDDTTLSIGGLVAGVIVLVLSVLLGGYVAGRVARYEGARNGLLAAVLFVLLTAGVGGLAAGFDDVRDAGLPSWLDSDLTLAAIITAAVALVLVLLAGLLGGRLGARWHGRVDDVLLHTRTGGVRR